MSDIDPTKLKVAELREELKARGLDTKGVKAVLAKRLIKAINAEEGNDDAADVSVGDLDTTTEDTDTSFQETPSKAKAPPPVVEPEPVEEPEPSPEPVQEISEPEPVPEVKPEPVPEVIPEPVVPKAEVKPAPVPKEEVKAEPVVKPEPVETEDEVKPATEQKTEVKEEVSEEASKEEPMEQEDVQNGNKEESAEADDKSDRNRKRKRSGSRDRRRSRSGDRRRSRSKERERRHSPPRKPVEMDDDTWETGTDFKLDRYNCDLNLRVDDNGVKAQPLSVEGFAFMWAGARTMFGVSSGKIAYEVKLLENLNVEHLPQEESNPHVLRVGWSVDSTTLQLGEEALSYGYGGTAKASTNCEFKDFGQTFTQGDVITTYLDLESEPATVSYSKNGEDLGTCFEIEKATIEEKSMFPHILTKNTEFECNFGKKEEPFFPLKEGFVFIEEVSEENRVRGAVPPAKKEECEMIMLVGLPGAGKTTWAAKHTEQNPDKKYNILGTNNIIDKMKVMGLPRKRNYSGRWDVLIDMSTKCLNRAIEIAARKKRNYILDQTNVYGSARRRKMQPFEGFQRKAVVILPSDEDFKSRIAQREKEEGKDIPEKAVLDMKANFTLPEEGQLFDSVEFIELKKEEADKLTETYRKEGLAANPERRWRDNRWSGGGGYRDNRRGGGGGSYYDKDRYNRNSGYRDYRSRNSYGSYDRRSGGYGSYNSGGDYRNDRYDRNRQGSYKYDKSSSDRRTDSYGSGGYGKSQGWGNQQGSWGQGGWGQGGWGQGYASGWGGYGQTGSADYSNWNQGWGQNYWQGYPQSSHTTSQVPDYSQWYGQYNNTGSSGTAPPK